jgi:hypothetical protein
MRVEDAPPPSTEHDANDPIVTALSAPGEDRVDTQAGRGRGYRLTNQDGSPLLFLETFGPRLVRITTPKARIEITDLGSPVITAEDVAWEQDDSSLSITRNGSIAVRVTGQRSMGADGSEKALPAVTEGMRQDDAVPLFSRDSAAQESTSQDRSVPHPERQQRVRLFGRLGKDPLFRVTATKKLVGQFPLAVRLDEETVRWEKIVAHGPRAEKLRDELRLAKGQTVEVIGYRHTQTRKDRTGQDRIVEEIYVVAVIPR